MNQMKSILGVVLLFTASLVLAQGPVPVSSAPIAQIVALDECEPSSFNAMLGPDFCKNIALGAVTSFSKLFNEALEGRASISVLHSSLDARNPASEVIAPSVFPAHACLQ